MKFQNNQLNWRSEAGHELTSCCTFRTCWSSVNRKPENDSSVCLFSHSSTLFGDLLPSKVIFFRWNKFFEGRTFIPRLEMIVHNAMITEYPLVSKKLQQFGCVLVTTNFKNSSHFTPFKRLFFNKVIRNCYTVLPSSSSSIQIECSACNFLRTVPPTRGPKVDIYFILVFSFNTWFKSTSPMQQCRQWVWLVNGFVPNI